MIWNPPAGGVAAFPESARVSKQTTDQTISDSTDTAVTFNTEEEDTARMFDAAVPTRLTAQGTGLFIVAGYARFAANAVNERQLSIVLNGTTPQARERRRVAAAGVTTLCVQTLVKMVAGDYLEMWALQNSGGDLAVQAAETEFMATFLAA